MVSDCAFAEQHTGKALGWARAVGLLGFDADFERETGEVLAAVIQATQNCMEEAIKPCIDWGNAAQARRILAYERQRQLLGIDGPPNIYDATLVCGELEGTFNAVLNDGGMRQTVQAIVKFSIDRASVGAGGRSYIVKSGQITWQGELAANGCKSTVLPVSAPVRANDGSVTIMQVGSSQRYGGRGLTMLPNSSVIIECPGGDPQTAPWPVGAQAWLSIPLAPGMTLPQGARSMSGQHSDGRTTWTWTMQLVGGAGAPILD
jgi:hypothetical protein